MSLHATVQAAPSSAGTTSVVSCLTVPPHTGGAFRPGPGADRGPCTRPETLQLVPGSDPAVPPTLLTNFGLVMQAPGGSRYELVCDDYTGGRSALRVARRSDGSLLLPGASGVYVSSDGAAACGIVRAAGSLVDVAVADVVIAPDPAGTATPAAVQSVWALSGQIDSPRSLHVSTDGGASFAVKQPLAGGVFAKLLVAPSDPGTLYVAGFMGNTPLVLLGSSDGGASFTRNAAGPEVFQRPATGVEVLGVHPSQPRVLLLAAGSPAGADEIWRSTDGGAGWAKVFTLRGMEVQSGFLWRTLEGGGDELLIAGRELFRQPGQPPAHLYRSRDGGLSFEDPIPSPETGPRYRCLAAQGSRLYACAGDDGDSFLTGVSDDGGHSWTPLARLGDIAGSRPCASGLCLTTAIWLCETYGAACAGLAPPDAQRPESPDAGQVIDCVGDRCDDGCSCHLGGRTRALPAAIALTLAVLLALSLRRRARPSERNP